MNHFQKIICGCAIAGTLMLPGIVLGQQVGQPAYGGSSTHQQNRFAQEYVQPDAGDLDNRFAGDAFPPHSRFDPNVQPAELMVQSTPPSSTCKQDSPDQILGSASGMMSSLANTMQTQWQQGGWSKKMKSLFADTDISRMLGSLAIVLGGYFALVWVSRQFSLGAGRGVPQRRRPADGPSANLLCAERWMGAEHDDVAQCLQMANRSMDVGRFDRIAAVHLNSV